MPRIITPELITRALEMVMPATKEILNDPRAIWGPRWVNGEIDAPGLEKPYTFGFQVTESRKWNNEWGNKVDFAEIAHKKLAVVKRLGLSTGAVAKLMPWLLMEGEYLYAGGAWRDGICVAVSGAKSATDEAIAEMIISAIVMLSLLDAEKRLAEGKTQI